MTDSYGMTDEEFDRFLEALDRACIADAKGTTRIGKLYQPGPTPSTLQQDYSHDIAQAKLDDELYGDNN